VSSRAIANKCFCETINVFIVISAARAIDKCEIQLFPRPPQKQQQQQQQQQFHHRMERRRDQVDEQEEELAAATCLLCAPAIPLYPSSTTTFALYHTWSERETVARVLFGSFTMVGS
jgi:hypothetical protein